MAVLARDYHISHKLTMAYSPWSNGTVEAANRNFMAAVRALTTEAKLGPHDWPELIAPQASIINEAPTSRLGKRPDGVFRSPLEVMTELQPRRLLLRSGGTATKTERLTLERIKAEQLSSITALAAALEEMHKKVVLTVSKNRARQLRAHNKRHQYSRCQLLPW